MRRLIHLFFISIILIYSNNLLSQDIGIQLDRSLGVIESVFIKHGKTVFELDSANNNIKNIYVFSDDSLSERFLQDPVYDFRPRRSLELHRGVKLYIDTYRYQFDSHLLGSSNHLFVDTCLSRIFHFLIVCWNVLFLFAKIYLT